MQLWSFDDGRTWEHSGTVLAYVKYFMGTHWVFIGVYWCLLGGMFTTLLRLFISALTKE